MTHICMENHDELFGYDEFCDSLSDSQSWGNGRHICVICAYNAGYDYISNPETYSVHEINYLPESQRSSGRHKSARQAYIIGMLHAATGSGNLFN